ncbi:MAG TPA: heparinase II/III family protein, partial [Oceanipulchritudo sp.]|nr:heparinase II/III family protein [Oceanipulchritudo sp.]
KLLWTVPELMGEAQDNPRTRTAELPFAGLFLQRNLSTSENAKRDSMMAVVSGASYVHSHASGMSLELFGLGEVIGTDGGVGTYTTEIHENYYRLFAAHNTVVSNGASATWGPWVNLGMEKVELESMEPLPGEEAISPSHSFSTTSFWDRHNLVRQANHQRTVALIRTSPTSGYYVDIFRARSDHPDEFHDYIYRNVGETFEFVETPGDFAMTPTPDRFQASADLPWSRNSRYRHPGWHYFTDVSTASTVDGPVLGKFSMNKIIPRSVMDIINGVTVTAAMDVHMTGAENRSYSKALSPPSITAPGVSTELHTMVVRQNGEAWSDPFVNVFESYVEEQQGPSIQSVEKLMDAGEFKGLIVESMVDGETLHQYILNPDDAGTPYSNSEYGFTFTGHFAVLTTDAQGQLLSIYIGDGDSLQYQDTLLTTNASTRAAFLDTDSPEQNWIEYSEALGWVEYSDYPFIYSIKFDGWLYHPYDGLLENQEPWFYIFKPEE